jgi:hypothetical protein
MLYYVVIINKIRKSIIDYSLVLLYNLYSIIIKHKKKFNFI